MDKKTWRKEWEEWAVKITERVGDLERVMTFQRTRADWYFHYGWCVQCRDFAAGTQPERCNIGQPLYDVYRACEASVYRAGRRQHGLPQFNIDAHGTGDYSFRIGEVNEIENRNQSG